MKQLKVLLTYISEEIMYSYSIDNENYFEQFETIEKVKLKGFEDNPDYDIIWIGEIVNYTPSDFIDTEQLLDSIANNAYDEVGEPAEDWLDEHWQKSNVDKVQELVDLISTWVKNNIPITFWTVKNIIEFRRN